LTTECFESDAFTHLEESLALPPSPFIQIEASDLCHVARAQVQLAEIFGFGFGSSDQPRDVKNAKKRLSHESRGSNSAFPVPAANDSGCPSTRTHAASREIAGPIPTATPQKCARARHPEKIGHRSPASAVR